MPEGMDLKPPLGTEALCKHVVSASFDDLSDDNVRIFKDRLLDITGCILGGSNIQEDSFVTQYFKDKGGKAEASVFTKNCKFPLADAVQLNSLYARSNDFGCMFFHAFGEHIASHCSETLIPTGLTVATTRKTSGKEFILNDIVAEDFTARILYSLPVRWPTDMLLVSSAATVLVARSFGVNEHQLKSALSYAVANCTDPGNAYYDYAEEFRWHNAESARMGVMAVVLAQGGWRGYDDPYFGHWGLVSKQLEKGESLPTYYGKIFENLGKTFYTEESFKRYPGGIPTTAAANCGRAIRAQILSADGAFDPAKIKQVHVYRSQNVRYNYYSNPFTLRNHNNALFSFQFSACCALYYGKIEVSDVQTSSILSHPDLYRMAEESTMDLFQSDIPALKMVVDMVDGRTFESVQDYAASMHQYPTPEFLEDKFRSQATFGGMMRSVQDKVLALSRKIEELDDMREYTQLIEKIY